MKLLLRLLVAVAALSGLFTPAFSQFADQNQYVANSTGSANAYAIAVPNMPTTIPQGIPFRFRPNFSNTGPATITIGGVGPVNLYKPSPSGPVQLGGGELVAGSPGQMVEVVYDGTQAVITSSINSTLSNIFLPPQGYLTPCPTSSPPTGCTAGQLLPTADVTVGVGQTVTGIVYTPGPAGNQISLWNGSSYVVFQFPQLTLTMNAAHVASTIYDACVFSNAGVPTLVTGPAWSNSGAGSGSRGTGAGTAEITRLGGLWVNAVAITGRNGATTYSIPINQCTLVGSLVVSGSNGVLVFHVASGTARQWAISNAYNRQQIVLQESDPTTSWAYTSTIRQSNGNASNYVQVFSTLPEESYDTRFSQEIGASSGAAISNTIGIGFNVTNAYCGTRGAFTPANINGTGTVIAQCPMPPSIGIQKFNALETGGTGGFFMGTSLEMQLTARWRG